MNPAPFFRLAAAVMVAGAMSLSASAQEQTEPQRQEPAVPLPMPRGDFAPPPAPSPAPPAAPQPTTRPAPTPEERRAAVDRALAYLAENQRDDGGWAQGEVSEHMRGGMQHENHLFNQSNVADTAAATLTFMQAGSSPVSGDYAEVVSRGLSYLCDQVEKSDEKSLSVTDHQGTCVQRKLGQFADTFFAAHTLAEARAMLAEAEIETPLKDRVEAALDKTIRKIEAHQTEGGGWDQQGWATALSQGMGQKALNKAARTGATVSEEALRRSESQALGTLSAGFAGGALAADSAGVELYARASNVATLRDAAATNDLRERALRTKLEASPDMPAGERDEIEGELKRIDETRQSQQQAQREVASRLGDARFVAGFGSNGGEEFLSYLHLAEALAADAQKDEDGAKAWRQFEEGIAPNLIGVQEPDGSWSGHHCITGKTFCTALATQVLLVEAESDAAAE